MDAAPSGSLEDLISRVMPAVVTIQTPSSRGSGFFVAADTIITNVHVVGTEPTVTIRRPDGTTTTARVEATAPAFDIAVLKVLGVRTGQAVIPLGAAAAVRIGEEVIAIGTPLGFLQNTVTRGIVSGLRDVGGATLVQTDAAINPGNSGGPLLDRSGTAVGVIKSGYVGSDGLSFAVAIEHARAVLEGRTQAPGAPSAPTQYQALSPAVASPTDQRRLDATRAFEEAIAQAGRARRRARRPMEVVHGLLLQRAHRRHIRPAVVRALGPRAMQGVVSSELRPVLRRPPSPGERDPPGRCRHRRSRAARRHLSRHSTRRAPKAQAGLLEPVALGLQAQGLSALGLEPVSPESEACRYH